MIDKSYPFSSWGQGCIRNSCMDPNFFGLPLNSHGELINFNSSGNVGTNQLETSSPLGGSASGLPSNNILCQSSQENLTINERQFVQKTLPKDGLSSLPHYPPKLDVTELSSHREDIHPPNSEMYSSHHVQPLHPEFLKHNSCVEQNQCERVQNHNRNGMVSLKEGSDHISLSSCQPTVRLMGKDVPIARSSQAPMDYKALGDFLNNLLICIVIMFLKMEVSESAEMPVLISILLLRNLPHMQYLMGHPMTFQSSL
ncbi:hypothetical protein A2U01_0022952, partial [Trifolium medium]|nr:hypothetical protein [Trifolium medium]